MNYWKDNLIVFGIKVVLANRFFFWLFRKTVNAFKKTEKAAREKLAGKEIDKLRQELVLIVSKLFLEGKCCFRSGKYQATEEGGYWRLTNSVGLEVPGKFLVEFFPKRSGWALGMSKKIARDYQRVIGDYFTVTFRRKENLNKKGLLVQGQKWLFGKLLLWSGPIVEAGLMSHREVYSLADEFLEIISQRESRFFGYAHGNIIGNHIFFREGFEEIPYLLGMRIVLRPGNRYYDFLRALDWHILNTPEDENKFSRIKGYILGIRQGTRREEVKTVFALRCIGVLGWDMLHLDNLGVGDVEEKKKLLLRFIRKDY